VTWVGPGAESGGSGGGDSLIKGTTQKMFSAQASTFKEISLNVIKGDGET
jgi:hypothetical protein